MELVRYTFPTWIVPLSNVIFILTAVMVINSLVRLLLPGIALRHGELLVLYVMLSITTTLSAGDILQAILSILGYAFWFATPENEFQELFIRHIPRWLTVSDEAALRDFYDGESTLYLEHHLKVWTPVVLAWLLVFLVLAFNFLCLNTILRRQWTEHERLTYPIAQLALEMTRPKGDFFRNKRMWIGLGIAAGIGLLNGLHTHFPQVPFVPVKRTYYTVTEGPLSFFADGGDLIRLSLYPYAVGILFLMPLDMLLSTTFFCGLYRVQLTLGDIMGWDNLPRFPFHREQILGGFLGLCVFVFWTGKGHFIRVIKRAFGWRIDLRDSEEPLPYRAAVWGLVIGLIVLTFLLRRAGMTFWVAATFGLLLPDCANRNDPASRGGGGVRLLWIRTTCDAQSMAGHPTAWTPKPDIADRVLLQQRVPPAADAAPARRVQNLGPSQSLPSKDVCRDTHCHRGGRACLFLDSAPHVLRSWGGFGLFRSLGIGARKAVVRMAEGLDLLSHQHRLVGRHVHGRRVLGDDASRLSALKSLLDAFAPTGILDSRRGRVAGRSLGAAYRLHGGKVAHPQKRRYTELPPRGAVLLGISVGRLPYGQYLEYPEYRAECGDVPVLSVTRGCRRSCQFVAGQCVKHKSC